MSELFNFPVEKDLESDENRNAKNSGERVFENRQYIMQPTKDREVGNNLLFFTTFRPSEFRLFKEWPQDASTWYLKFFVHWVTVRDEETGKERRECVVCEPEMNKYAKERLTQPHLVFPPPFPEVDSCAFCDQAQDFWDDYRQAKLDNGITRLSTDEFKKAMQAHPEIGELRDKARDWTASERVYFVVFDYDKWSGGKAANGATTVTFQYLWTGTKILTELFKEYKGGFKFYDPTGNNAIVDIERDNSKGTRYANYDVRLKNEPPGWDEETLEYLTAASDVPDPSDSVKIWTPGQKVAFVQQVGTPSVTVDDVSDASETPTVEVKAPVSPPKPRVNPRSTIKQDENSSSPTRRQRMNLTFRGGEKFTP